MPTMHVYVQRALIGSIIVGLGVSEAAAQRYTSHDLGTLGGGNSAAFAINDSGAVVGASETADGSVRAFLWTRGVMMPLESLGEFGLAAGITNDGDIAGATGAPRPVLLRNGAVMDLGSLGGPFGFALAISKSGRVIGVADTDATSPPFSNSHGFLWENGVMVDLGTLGGPFSAAQAVNDLGQVVGYSSTSNSGIRAVLWKNGRAFDLGVLGVFDGQGFSQAAGINNRGQIVGSSTTMSSIGHAVLWDRGVIVDLGTLPGDQNSVASGINESGDIVGNSSGFADQLAVLWKNRQVVNLGVPAGYVISFATAINGRGDIVGTACRDTDCHAVLWTRAER